MQPDQRLRRVEIAKAGLEDVAYVKVITGMPKLVVLIEPATTGLQQAGIFVVPATCIVLSNSWDCASAGRELSIVKVNNSVHCLYGGECADSLRSAADGVFAGVSRRGP